MIILLPPSEGKTAPSEGAPVDLDALAFGGLTKTRARLLDVLSRLTSRSSSTGARWTSSAECTSPRSTSPFPASRSTASCCASSWPCSWIPEGHVPTVQEAEERLEHLRAHGPTPEAFTFSTADLCPA